MPMTDLPGNAEGVARPWPYAHTMDELDRCWDAYMEATVTDGHPLAGTFVPLAEAGVQPYHLSQIFDLVLTAGEEMIEELLHEVDRNEPYPHEEPIVLEVGETYRPVVKATWNGQTWQLPDGSNVGTRNVVDVLDAKPGD
jgi:hypothetical protein